MKPIKSILRMTGLILAARICAYSVILTATLHSQNEAPEVFVELGHNYSVETVAFSFDGKYVISGSWDNTLKQWDVSTGKEIRTFRGHVDLINCVSISLDSKYILSGSYDRTLKLWDVSTGKEIQTFIGHSGRVLSIAFSPDGKYVLSGSSNKTLKLWDVSTGKEIRTFRGHTDWVNSVAFSPDGNYVISGSRDKTLKLWDVSTGKEIRTFRGHTDWVNSVAFSPNGNYVISGSRNKTLKLWDVSIGKEILMYSMSIYFSAFSPDGKYVVSESGDTTLKLWDVSTDKEIRTFRGHTDRVNSVAFSPDGKYIISGSWDKTLKLWDVSTGREIRTFRGHTDRVNSVAFSPDGEYVISGIGDNLLKLWDVAKGKAIRTFTGYSVAFSPNSKYVISGGGDKTLKLWDVSTGKEIRTFIGHTDWVNSVAFSPDGKYGLSVSDDKTAKLWIIESGKEKWTYRDEDSLSINDFINFSPDGKYVLLGINETLILCDVLTGKHIQSFKGHYDGSYIETAAILPEGKHIISGHWDKTLKLWNIETGRELRTFSGHSGGVRSVAISPDGRYAISGSVDKTLKLWDIATGEEIRTYTGHNGTVFSVAFSPVGRYALSGSLDGTIRIWDINTGKEIASFVSFKDGEWIVITTEGYFNASPNGAKYLNVRMGNNVYSIDNFYNTYYRPDIVRAKLNGESIDQLIKKKLSDGLQTPPDIEISVETSESGFLTLSSLSSSIDLNEYTGSRGITLKQKIIKTEDDILKIKVKAKNTGGGISGIKISNNGKSIEEAVRGIILVKKDDVLEREYKIDLLSGENRISIVGVSNDGSESNPVELVLSHNKASQVKPDMYILAIGIDEYDNSAYNLNYCVNDCKGFVEALQSKAAKLFGKVNVKTLLNREATRETILSEIVSIRKNSRPEDVFALYYAGHGYASYPEVKEQPEFFFVLPKITQMSDISQCRKYGISGIELKDSIKAIKAGKQVLFLDACNSGAFSKSFSSRGNLQEDIFARLKRATGLAVFAATTTEQLAIEVKQLGHGIFTYTLIEAINGKASNEKGEISTARIGEYLNDYVPVYAEKYRGSKQYPWKHDEGMNFPIGLK